MARDKWRMHVLLETKGVIRPSQAALTRGLVSEMDLLRLKTIARLHARGLAPQVGWDDLLQEAFTRVLTGSRTRPPGVTMVAFLAGVMRSLRSERWRRSHRDVDRDASTVTQPMDAALAAQPPGQAPDPERSFIAAEQRLAIERLFADDPAVLQIIAGLGEGLSAEQISAAMRISRTEYDSARRRMRRCLLRIEAELIGATDEEILEAAKDLGMDPSMRGSAAFLGLKYPVAHRAGFFGSAQEPWASAAERLQELGEATKDPREKD